MFQGARDTHRVGLLVMLATACRPGTSAPTPLERSIDAELGIRFGVPVSTQCLELVRACVTRLPDGSSLPITVHARGGGWEWHVEGMVVTTADLEVYLRAEVAELGVPQDVRCTPRIRLLVAGERIECWLARGGKAFILVRADGATSIEIALDAAAANARSELVTPARDEALSRTSRALEAAGANVDGEDGEAEAPPLDAPGDLLASPPGRR